MSDLIARIDEQRRARGFLTVAETLMLSEQGVTVMDPFSTLISGRATLSAGILIWPNVTIAIGESGRVSIGAETVLHSGVRIEAGAGEIRIGAGCDIGQEGGFTLLATGRDDVVTIGDCVRLNGGGSVAIRAEIGDGAQIIGPIRAQHCRLGAGGSYREPDPDRRGGVLKGTGVARNLDVPTGMVMQAFGIFADAPLRSQTYFHPKNTA